MTRRRHEDSVNIDAEVRSCGSKPCLAHVRQYLVKADDAHKRRNHHEIGAYLQVATLLLQRVESRLALAVVALGHDIARGDTDAHKRDLVPAPASWPNVHIAAGAAARPSAGYAHPATSADRSSNNGYPHSMDAAADARRPYVAAAEDSADRALRRPYVDTGEPTHAEEFCEDGHEEGCRAPHPGQVCTCTEPPARWHWTCNVGELIGLLGERTRSD